MSLWCPGGILSLPFLHVAVCPQLYAFDRSGYRSVSKRALVLRLTEKRLRRSLTTEPPVDSKVRQRSVGRQRGKNGTG
ncbi:hypothetical protein GGI35DRAFT_463620 [Trichoderma velutinum]